jgi:RES domain-containing protein
VIVTYRLHSSRYPENDGFGAAMYGGRWNERRTRAVYTAASRSLAVLEILVNYAALPRDFVITPVRIPDRVKIFSLPQALLAHGWQEAMAATQILGGSFLRNTAVLCVPSAVIPEESNYVLNPEHTDFRHIEFHPSEPFLFDPRLERK